MDTTYNQTNRELSVFKQLAEQAGLIGGQIIKENNKFVISFASLPFYKLSKIEENKPISANEGFAFLPKFEIDFLAEFIEDRSISTKSAVFNLPEGHYRLDLNKSDDFILFTLSNVTPLNNLQRELGNTNKQMSEIQEMANIGHWVEDHRSKEHTWSNNIYNLLEVPLHSLKPSFESYLQFVHPEDKKIVTDGYKDTIIHETGKEQQHRLKLASGKVKHVSVRYYTTFSKQGKPVETFGIIQDVSTYENTKKQLKQSEQMFRSVIQDAPIAVVLVNKNTQPLLSNQQFCNITGYSMDEVLKHNLEVFTYKEDLKDNKNSYKQLFAGELDKFTVTKRYLKKDKSIIWVRVTVSAVKKKNKNPETAIAMVQDITAEKEATKELIKSEYKYRTLIENANDGIGLFSTDFKPFLYNTALYGDLGYSIEDYLKINHLKFELFHPDDRKDASIAIEKVKNREKVRIEKRLRTFTGEYKHFSISYIPVQHDNKPAILIFRRDISKRKAAEEQNEEYRLFLETIMENLPVSLFAKTVPDFRYLYWNKAAERMSGIAAEDAIGRTDYEIYQFKEDAEKVNEQDKKLVKWKGKFEGEVKHTNSKGEVKYLKLIKTLHQSPTGSPMLLGISMDVTQLKAAESKNEQSTQMLKEAQKIAKLGYWEYDIEKNLFFDNIENRQILGTEDLPYFLNLQQFIGLLLTSDQQVVEQKLKKAIAKSEQGELFTRLNVDGKVKHININYKPIFDDNDKVIKLMGTSLDISRVKESELALIESENRLKQAEHIAKLGNWNHNYSTNKTTFSDEVWNLLGLSPNNKAVEFVDYLTNVLPADKLAVISQFGKAKKSGKPFSIDFRILSANKKERYIRATGTFIHNTNGEIVNSVGTFQDISATKNKELKLTQLSTQLNEIQQLAKIGFYEYDILNNSYKFSDTIYSLLELDKKTKPLNNSLAFNEYIHPEDKETIITSLDKTLKEEGNHNIHYRIKLSSGKIKYINEICRIDSSQNPQRKYMTRIFQDVSDFKSKDFEIKQQKEYREEIRQKAFIGTWEYNIKTDAYTLSKELVSILNLKKDSLSFKEVIKIIHPEDRHSVKKILLNSFEKKQGYTLNYRMMLPSDKSVHYIQDSGRVLKNPQGEWTIYGIVRDLTDIHLVKQQLDDTYEVFESITENSIFAILIFSNEKISYLNKQWAKLLNINAEDIPTKKELKHLFKTETTNYFKEVFDQWEDYGLESYVNKIQIQPIISDSFSAEIFVKKIWIKGQASFMVLTHKTSE